MLAQLHYSPPPFERVYRDHYGFVWATLRAVGVSDGAVDDAAQDVYVVVHRRLPDFEGRASIKTWLYEITRRVASRYRSRAANDAVRSFELPDLRAADDLDVAADRAMAAEILRSFIATLDEDRRRAFVLAEFWQMRGREIAEALDVNLNTVYARLRSARSELERMAHRLQAKDAATLTRAMRATSPSRESQERAWAALAVQFGSGSAVAAAATNAAGFGITGWWMIAAGLVGVLVVATNFADSGGHEPPTQLSAGASTQDDEHKSARGSLRAPTSPAPQPNEPSEETITATAPTIRAAPNTNTAAERSTTSPTKAKPTSVSLSAELKRVRAIRQAVARRDAEAARTLTHTYRRQFVQGSLRVEVDALEVELACRTSATDAAQKLGAFRRRRPDSRLLLVVEKTCAPQLPSTTTTD